MPAPVHIAVDHEEHVSRLIHGQDLHIVLIMAVPYVIVSLIKEGEDPYGSGIRISEGVKGTVPHKGHGAAVLILHYVHIRVRDPKHYLIAYKAVLGVDIKYLFHGPLVI